LRDPPVRDGEHQREQPSERGGVHDDAGEQTQAGLHRAAYQFGGRCVAVAVVVRFGGVGLRFERDGTFERRLPEGAGEPECEQSGDQSRQHAADQQRSNHASVGISGREN
jgi:hypothetical protein